MEKYKKLFTVTAIVLAVVLTLGLILGIGYGVGWFGSDEEEGEAAVASNVIMNNGKSNGITLTSKTLYDEGADMTTKDNSDTYEVTATITPANTSDQSVTMSVAWADASSDWAAGKDVSDYVTITQESEGALTGTLACTQAFGEQVILTVTLDSDTTVTASAYVDYVARVTGFTVNFYSGNYIILGGSYNNGFYGSVTYGTGTIYGYFSEFSLYLDLINDTDAVNSIYNFMLTYVQPFATANSLELADFAGCLLGSVDINDIRDYTLGDKTTYDTVQHIVMPDFMDFVAAMIPDATDAQLEDFEENYLNEMTSAYIDYLDSNSNEYCVATLTIKYTYIWEGTDGGVTTYGSGYMSGDDCLYITASGLSVNGTGLAFNSSAFCF